MSDMQPRPYDVFISYRWITPDQDWVQNQLVPALERAGLRVCIDVEDFVPGRNVFNEMSRGDAESKHALCILSPDYFEGNRMVSFESMMALQNDPAGAESRLIPFILRATPLPKWIRALIPINWTDVKNHSREWRKLLKALGAANTDALPPSGVGTEPESNGGSGQPPTTIPLPTRPITITALNREGAGRSLVGARNILSEDFSDERCKDYNEFIKELASLDSSEVKEDNSDLFLLLLNAQSPKACDDLRKYFRTTHFPSNARQVKVEGIYDMYGRFDFLIKLRFRANNLNPVRHIVADLRHLELIPPCICREKRVSEGDRRQQGGDKCISCTAVLVNVTNELYPGKWTALDHKPRMNKAFFQVTGWSPDRYQNVMAALYPGKHRIHNVALSGLYFSYHRRLCEVIAEYCVGCGGFYDLVNLTLEIEKWLDNEVKRTTLLVMKAELETVPHS